MVRRESLYPADPKKFIRSRIRCIRLIRVKPSVLELSAATPNAFETHFLDSLRCPDDKSPSQVDDDEHAKEPILGGAS